jgi:peptidyl-prolyl cis-trans isomerase B (cyclophilin B)
MAVAIVGPRTGDREDGAVATNQMRREAAKRKLERQQERRAQEAARRKKVAVITAATVAVLMVAGVVALTVARGGDEPTAPIAAAPPTATCAFNPEGQPAKAVTVPDVGEPEKTGTVAVTLTTNQGAIPLTLDRSKAPCTVESFLHLAQAGFFDATPCHRLTTEGIKVLQCGDPTGTGSGGPGYSFADETSPDLQYPRGTLAMANSGPDTNGSQFFMVYGDSQLPPDYTVFGSIGEPGLAVIDAVAAAGSDSSNGPGDGAPNQPVTIESAAVS